MTLGHSQLHVMQQVNQLHNPQQRLQLQTLPFALAPWDMRARIATTLVLITTKIETKEWVQNDNL